MEELQCDITHVLQNGDFSILKKLETCCNNIQTSIESNVQDTNARETECTQKLATTKKKISELEQQISALKFHVEDTKLQRKIVDKEIANKIKQVEKLKNNVQDVKINLETLSLELVDLEQDRQERRQKKVKTWEAVKRAANTYKTNLDIKIHLQNENDIEHVKISFFRKDASVKDKYYVCLIYENELWKVEHIQPMIEKKHWKDFKGTVDFNKQHEVSDITAFLCLLRSIFLKYYMNV